MAIEPKSKQLERTFPFLQVNEREGKPRKRGLTEIRGSYYSVVGRRYLEDLFEVMGAYVDSLKFAGGSFALMSETAVRNIIELCHDHDVLVSTGGFLEHVLVQGRVPCSSTLPNAKGWGSISSSSQRASSLSQLMIGCGLSSWCAIPG